MTTATTARPKRKIAHKRDDKPTLAVVPPKAIAREYVGRRVHGSDDFTIMKFCMQTKTNLLIEGPTGSGKTLAAQAFAAKHGYRFYATPSNAGIEPSQLFGKFIPMEGGGFAWQDGPVTDIVRNGGVLLINEVNFIPERISTVLFSLLDKRRNITLLDHKGEVIPCHDDVLIIADMNPNYEGTRPLNKAFRNRFGVQLKWDYDENVEKKLVSNEGLVSLANDLRESLVAGTGIVTPVSTNMLIEFERISFSLGVDFAMDNFVTHFSDPEKDAVRVVLQTFRANIEDGCRAYREEKEENNNWKPGDWTADDGLYGTDWVVEEVDE